MDLNSPVTCLLSSQTLTITPAHQGIQGARVKQKLPSRLSKDNSLVLSVQDKTPILPCWHIGAHPLMPTSVHQLICYTRGPSTPHYHKGSITRTPMLQMTMMDSTNAPPRVQSTTSTIIDPSPHCMQGKLSVLNDTRTLWFPAKVIRQTTHGSYLVQVIGGGQYRHACDHIHERYPDAVKPDTSTTPVVAPATPDALTALFAVSPPSAPAAPVASATPPTSYSCSNHKHSIQITCKVPS